MDDDEPAFPVTTSHRFMAMIYPNWRAKWARTNHRRRDVPRGHALLRAPQIAPRVPLEPARAPETFAPTPPAEPRDVCPRARPRGVLARDVAPLARSLVPRGGPREHRRTLLPRGRREGWRQADRHRGRRRRRRARHGVAPRARRLRRDHPGEEPRHRRPLPLESFDEKGEGYRFDTGPSLMLLPDRYREQFTAVGKTCTTTWTSNASIPRTARTSATTPPWICCTTPNASRAAGRRRGGRRGRYIDWLGRARASWITASPRSSRKTRTAFWTSWTCDASGRWRSP